MISIIILVVMIIVCVIAARVATYHLLVPAKPKLLPEASVKALERELGITVENRLANQYEENEKWLAETDAILNPLNPPTLIQQFDFVAERKLLSALAAPAHSTNGAMLIPVPCSMGVGRYPRGTSAPYPVQIHQSYEFNGHVMLNVTLSAPPIDIMDAKRIVGQAARKQYGQYGPDIIVHSIMRVTDIQYEAEIRVV